MKIITVCVEILFYKYWFVIIQRLYIYIYDILKVYQKGGVRRRVWMMLILFCDKSNHRFSFSILLFGSSIQTWNKLVKYELSYNRRFAIISDLADSHFPFPCSCAKLICFEFAELWGPTEPHIRQRYTEQKHPSNEPLQLPSSSLNFLPNSATITLVSPLLIRDNMEQIIACWLVVVGQPCLDHLHFC